jgi:prepilin-type N-terminal cleavage/methylation domain-containing protein
MKSNSKKCGGFTLIEVVISMAILSILSIAIYDGLMIIMKQIKIGQTKQAAALEGKKIIETMRDVSFDIPDSANNYEINLGNSITFNEKEDSNGQIEKDLSGNIFYIRNSGNYIEKVTLTPTKAANQTTGSSVELDTNGTLNYQSNKLYISKINSQDYISYWVYKPNMIYSATTDTSKVSIPGNSQSNIQLYVYFTADSNGNQIIDIKDYAGNDIGSLSTIWDKDLVINFSNYINSDGSVPTNDNIELDIYNTYVPAYVPKIYIEKSQDLNVDMEARKGEINVYDNRSENPQEDNFGTLYDITLQINDVNNNNLFTGYYKKNIG